MFIEDDIWFCLKTIYDWEVEKKKKKKKRHDSTDSEPEDRPKQNLANQFSYIGYIMRNKFR